MLFLEVSQLLFLLLYLIGPCITASPLNFSPKKINQSKDKRLVYLLKISLPKVHNLLKSCPLVYILFHCYSRIINYMLRV
ncbi:hypothetical protein P9112_012782 [Eukaryota sp. TZLM1-RC]